MNEESYFSLKIHSKLGALKYVYFSFRASKLKMYFHLDLQLLLCYCTMYIVHVLCLHVSFTIHNSKPENLHEVK